MTLLYGRFQLECDYALVKGANLFRGSSMVEQLPVKELVVGSSPTRGAK